MATKHPLPPKGGDEEDAFSKTASRYLGLDRRPGVRSYWKRHYNKRLRRQGKQESRTTRGLSSGWL